MKYKVVTLCGSTWFKEEFMRTQKELTLQGCIVISVGLFGHTGDEEVWKPGVKEMLDDMHLAKIDMADEIFVINVGGYIGESTRREIAYATSHGKPVRYLEPVIRAEIRQYVESEIIPRYDNFDKGHQRDHVQAVIERAVELCQYYDVDPEMVYVAAAYHDTGLCEGRELHHVASATIIRSDEQLRKWFTPEQIDIIADAAEDHRASLDHEPRTIYGKIIAEADRLIVPETVVRRTVQYGLSHYPEMDKEGHWNRMLEHLHDKYAEGGYLKLWIPESSNAARLTELRELIRDESKLRILFEKFYG